MNIAKTISADRDNPAKKNSFFKQKTAYEMLRSLVGSEMCIRDSRGDIRCGWSWQPVSFELSFSCDLKYYVSGTYIS